MPLLGKGARFYLDDLTGYHFKDELNLQKSSLIFRRIKDENSYPSCITKLLTKNSDRHWTSRYGRKNLVHPSYNWETEGGSSFRVSGAKRWNSFPLDIRKKESICAFKSSPENSFYPEILSLTRLRIVSYVHISPRFFFFYIFYISCMFFNSIVFKYLKIF